MVAGVTGILFVILGQAVLNFLGVRFSDFQIAGGLLLVVLAIIDLLTPGKAAVDSSLPMDPAAGIVPLAVPLILGPATMTTSLLLLNTYSKPYTEAYHAPLGQIIATTMVCAALALNMVLIFVAMWYSNKIVALFGRNVLTVVNKIVMILIAADDCAVSSLIRQGIVRGIVLANAGRS